jgi:WD40-like Beta Propeller Repeat
MFALCPPGQVVEGGAEDGRASAVFWLGRPSDRIGSGRCENPAISYWRQFGLVGLRVKNALFPKPSTEFDDVDVESTAPPPVRARAALAWAVAADADRRLHRQRPGVLAFARDRSRRPVRASIPLAEPFEFGILGQQPAFAISPDGTRLVYRTVGGGPLFSRLLNEAESSVIAGTDGALNPVFSPDGRWLAFFVGPARRADRCAVAGYGRAASDSAGRFRPVPADGAHRIRARGSPVRRGVRSNTACGHRRTRQSRRGNHHASRHRSSADRDLPDRDAGLCGW